MARYVFVSEKEGEGRLSEVENISVVFRANGYFDVATYSKGSDRQMSFNNCK